MSETARVQWTALLLGSRLTERWVAIRQAILTNVLRHPEPPPDSSDSPAEDWGAIQAQRPWRLAARVLAGCLALFVAAWIVGTRLVKPTRSEKDAVAAKAPRVPRPFVPSHPPNQALLGEIDLGKVHRELFPAWIIAMQHDPFSVGAFDAERTFFQLRAEAGKDPNLAALLTELNEKMLENLSGYSADIHLLFKGWNEYLERNGLPWRIEHHIEKTPRGPRLYTLSYHVLGDFRIAVGPDRHRVLLLSREDHTNLVEQYFGQTSLETEGAIIVTDRIADYATQQVWPLFGSRARDLSGLQRTFAPFVREEAVGALSAEVLRDLGEAADLRDSLADAVEALRSRKGCGRTVVIEEIAWKGLSDRALSMVRRAADRNVQRKCKRLTPTDAQFLETTSNQLASNVALEKALGRLAGWLAKAVTLHEVQHLVDDRSAQAGERTPPCPHCPESMGPNERAELRAYLSTFATEGIGYLSLMQACGTGGHGPGASGAALSYALSRLLPAGCDAAPPADLYNRARQLDAELFGASDPIVLPATFPTSVPVPR